MSLIINIINLLLIVGLTIFAVFQFNSIDERIALGFDDFFYENEFILTE